MLRWLQEVCNSNMKSKKSLVSFSLPELVAVKHSLAWYIRMADRNEKAIREDIGNDFYLVYNDLNSCLRKVQSALRRDYGGEDATSNVL